MSLIDTLRATAKAQRFDPLFIRAVRKNGYYIMGTKTFQELNDDLIKIGSSMRKYLSENKLAMDEIGNTIKIFKK